MKTKSVLLSLLLSFLFFSNCNFDVGDLGFGSGTWGYIDYGYLDSLNNYNPRPRLSSIHIEPDSVLFNGNSSATLYFSAIADTSVILYLVNGGLDKMAFVEQRYMNRKIDFNIVNISTDDCMQDISISSDSISLIMNKDETYNFCFFVNQLERDGFYFLYGYFYHHLLTSAPAETDSSEFYFEFKN